MVPLSNRSIFLLFLILPYLLFSTPPNVFWTSCTTDITEKGRGKLDVQNYFTIFNAHGQKPFYPVDIGLQAGLFQWNDWKVDAGFDYFGSLNNPLYLNVGMGIEESKLSLHAPSMKVAMIAIGTALSGNQRTNYNALQLIFGKKLPQPIKGQLFVGSYFGSKAMGKNRQGLMVAFQREFCPVKTKEGVEYNQWIFNADFASGKNVLGGGGFGFAYYFNPDVYILTGPTWFGSEKIYGDWKWTFQFEVNFDIFNSK